MTDAKTALIALGGAPESGASGLPNIPAVPSSDDSALTNILASMKLWMEKAAGEGFTGFASKADLIAAGVLRRDPSGAVKPVAMNMAVPPVPTGLLASGAMTTILVAWDSPMAAYGNHGYTEVWAAETDNFSSAVLVGQGAGFIFSHAVGEGSTRYYWIRFVSTSGIKGPFNSVNGTLGKTAKDPAFLMSVLTEKYGYGSAAPFFQVDAPITINGVTVPAGTYMKSAFIADASINNAKIGSLSADKITTGTLAADRIGANSITADKINGTNLSVVNGTFSGNLQGATGSFSGALSGATGTFAGRLAAGVLDSSSFSGSAATYSSAGTFSVTVPNNSSWTAVSMRVTLVGAGGGGQQGWGNHSPSGGAGAGGAAGSTVTGTFSNMTPGATLTLTVGAGGLGGGQSGNGAGYPGGTGPDGQPGLNGGTTTLSGYLSASGGVGGAKWLNQGVFTDPMGNTGGTASWQPGYAGANSSYAAGGAAGGVYTNGGNGVQGSGGGGGAASNYNPSDYQTLGGNGGAGYAIIEFFDPNFVVTNTRYSNLIAWLDSIGHGTVPTSAR